ncbi:MAG: type II secretion system F family protein [Parvularculaceae bacterium]
MNAINQFSAMMMDASTIIMLLTAIAAFATVYTIGAPLLTGNQLKTRMKAVSTHREELRKKHLEALAKGDKKQLRGATPSAFIKDVVEQLKLRELFDETGARKKLIMAGMRGQAPLFTFMFFRLVTPFALAFATAFYLWFVNDLGLAGNLRILAATMAFMIGFYLPSVIIQNKIAKRRDSIQRAFPDSLDLLLICVESGMSIEAAFNKVAQEVGATSIELAEELSLTTAELSYLQDRQVAYKNLAERTGVDGVKAVATALTQAERYGTPLGQTLRVLAAENREMRLQKAEKKAAALPAQLTVPMITFFLPALFIVIIGPSVIQVMSVWGGGAQ